MEPANLHHQHHLQEQLIGSSSLPTSSYYGVESNHAWNHDIILNGGYYNQHVNGILSNSRDLRPKNNILVPPSLNPSSMVQDLGFQWTNDAGSFTNHTADELNLAKIKDEFSDSFPTFTEMINNSPSNTEKFHSPSPSYIKHEQQDHLHGLSEKLFLKSFSSSCQINGLQLTSRELYSNAQNCATFGGMATPSGENLSHIFPSANISNLNPLSSSFSSSMGMNLQALDLLTSANFGGSFSEPSHQNLGIFKESLSFGLDHVQESSHRPPNSLTKVRILFFVVISPFTNGVAVIKRASNFSEPKASHAASKKPRSESRSSCPPFKVRKEKLGDRIAALQQLVAPFGKTDTASVLMEASGYIKFLHAQVQTLSVPYMNSSRNKTCRTMQEVSSGDGKEEPKRDLRSKGLCLVPLSFTAYVTDGSVGVWPPPNFRGST
ncbi:hypothetical protein HHK36_003091 [Tetracentron sinense]|uniref:BHLH domain-containing protein n=1 Tax=Tetracentron sinense TaxID=13715 RepID=A0A834ZS83_TETSI|nr:hypothetical protein HHK36_003091 [Tetracentron sinense]